MIAWLVISSYRNDEDVARILNQVHGCDQTVIDRVLVVDSEGTGVIPKLIKDRGWADVIYRSYGWNLGSGSNLCERLRIAAEAGADCAYALNHDGNFDAGVVSALLNATESLENLGAAYPLGYLTSVGAYNLTGTRELPLPAQLVRSRPSESLIDVFWSSSNGALYSTEPVRHGIKPWGLMWMGWEDLEYGWRLSSHGYRQVVVCNAIYLDNYEYKKAWFGRTVNKPAWRTYYQARNLILAIRRSRNQPLYHAVAAYRLMLEFGLILVGRDSKWERMKALFRGTVDGLRTAIDESSELQQCEPAQVRSSPQSAEQWQK
jgi:GT2 family glycosyltransferase